VARLYASTRQEEVARTGWDQDRIDAFLRMQFDAQHSHYREHYTDTAFDLILVDGEPAGRLYVGRWERELRIVDIALLPEHRGKGIGGRLLADLLAEADASRRVTSIHVERENRAMSLYRRLGFEPVEEVGPYFLFERPWNRPAS